MSALPTHDHDQGLQHDLQMISRRVHARRRVMGWLLAGGTMAWVSGFGGRGSDGNASSDTSNLPPRAPDACAKLPPETAGPYPADGSNTVNGKTANVLTASGIVRRNIRSSFGTSTNTASGVPLEFTLTLANYDSSCASMVGAAVYVWHCTREGGYSLYTRGIRNENYLRGVQVADANGQVTFQTIFPGAYWARYPHIHVEVYPNLAAATRHTNKTFTSQIVIPREICSNVYSTATGYDASVARLARTTLANDREFDDNTAAQLAAMTLPLSGSVAAGYTGSMVLGVPA